MPKINATNGSSNGRYHKPPDDLHYTLTGTLIWTHFQALIIIARISDTLGAAFNGC